MDTPSFRCAIGRSALAVPATVSRPWRSRLRPVRRFHLTGRARARPRRRLDCAADCVPCLCSRAVRAEALQVFKVRYRAAAPGPHAGVLRLECACLVRGGGVSGVGLGTGPPCLVARPGLPVERRRMREGGSRRVEGDAG